MAPPPPYPMSAGRIFQLGWSIFRFAWRPMFVAAALCLVPPYLLTVPLAAAFSARIDQWIAQVRDAATRGQRPPPLPDGLDIGIMALIAVTILAVLLSIVAVAAIVRIVDGVVRGQHIGGAAAARAGLGRLLSIFAGQLLYFVAIVIIVALALLVAGTLTVAGGWGVFLGLIVIVGALAAVLFVAVRTSLLSQTVMLEGVGGADGFSRSWRLVSGSGWRVFGYVIAVSLLGALISFLLASVPLLLVRATGSGATDIAIRTVIQAVVEIAIAPITPIVMTLLYLDLRWRHGETVPTPGGGQTTGPPAELARR